MIFLLRLKLSHIVMNTLPISTPNFLFSTIVYYGRVGCLRHFPSLFVLVYIYNGLPFSLSFLFRTIFLYWDIDSYSYGLWTTDSILIFPVYILTLITMNYATVTMDCYGLSYPQFS